jgi:predicted kinase
LNERVVLSRQADRNVLQRGHQLNTLRGKQRSAGRKEKNHKDPQKANSYANLWSI